MMPRQYMRIFLITLYYDLTLPTPYEASSVYTYISHCIILWFNTTHPLLKPHQWIRMFLITLYYGLTLPTLYEASPVYRYISHNIILWFNTTHPLGSLVCVYVYFS